jgi:predicted ABC-type ATPase
MYFVWISGLKGPSPQLWAVDQVDGNGKSRLSVLFKQKLTEEEKLLSFDQLILKFNEKKPKSDPYEVNIISVQSTGKGAIATIEFISGSITTWP